MDEVREIAGISVPFTSGVAAGLWAAGCPWSGIVTPGSQSVIYLMLTAAFISAAYSRHGRYWFIAAYLSAGMFCAAASAAAPMPGLQGTGLAGRCSLALKSLIDSIPFSSDISGALVKALMTGDRSSLTSDTVSIFRNSGASHILALSGLHLGIIYLMVSRCLSVFGNSVASRRYRCACVIIAAGFYTTMTGAGPSITRAFLFICIRELSGIDSGRFQSPIRTLLVCLTVQLALFPQELKSAGFQLSYLAMCGIVTILPVLQSWYPRAETKMGRLDPMRWIWNAAALAISCQLFTAPVSWLRFHNFPKFFLITNITAMPLTTMIMFLSVIVTLLCAAGICPRLLIETDERLISILTGVLETICTL